MIKPFVFSDFGAHLVNLERATSALELVLKPVAADPQFHQTIIRQAIPNMLIAVRGLVRDCDAGDLPLCHPVVSQIADLMSRLEDFDPGSEGPAVAENARLTRQAILNDLGQHLFFCVEGVTATQFDDAEPWGADVARCYPPANRDITAANRCFALREWTASIFHCMRVLEHGLAQIASRFDVTFKTESWHRVISDVEGAIATLREKRPLTEQDHKDITHYSEAAKEFRYFKDAWRNHVSHGRDWYDDRDARKVYDHVRDFMQQLAKPF